MNKRFWKKFNIPSSRLLTFAALVVVIYAAFGLTRITWANYKVNQHIKDLQKNISKIEDDNLELKNEIAYYQTESYKEKEAREKLGLQKEGENVIVISGTNDDKIDVQKYQEQEPKKQLSPKSNYQAWWDYFFAN